MIAIVGKARLGAADGHTGRFALDRIAYYLLLLIDLSAQLL